MLGQGRDRTYNSARREDTPCQASNRQMPMQNTLGNQSRQCVRATTGQIGRVRSATQEHVLTIACSLIKPNTISRRHKQASTCARGRQDVHAGPGPFRSCPFHLRRSRKIQFGLAITGIWDAFFKEDIWVTRQAASVGKENSTFLRSKRDQRKMRRSECTVVQPQDPTKDIHQLYLAGRERGPRHRSLL
jgi:hypothetical protein